MNGTSIMALFRPRVKRSHERRQAGRHANRLRHVAGGVARYRRLIHAQLRRDLRVRPTGRDEPGDVLLYVISHVIFGSGIPLICCGSS